MILEIAQIEIKPGLEAEFETGIEHPQRYRLLIHWDTLEAHTKDFTGSQPWQDYRALVSHCFAGPVAVEHAEQVLKAF
jgi:heme-degrading monooxygenase HmoA